MTQYLPPNLLALFAPRDPLPYLPPVDKLPFEKKRLPYTGIASFLAGFEETKDTPAPVKVETKDEKRERRRREKAEQVAYRLEQELALWDPATDENATGDPYKTLFVARINYDSSESKLRREFESYGPIRSIKMVYDRESRKPRGYAFIEYDHERDMHAAYKHADGKKIDGRRVLVDVERGRTVKGWRPRRLGGGLGGTRRGPPDMCIKHSGRDDSRIRERSDSRHRSRDRSKHRDRRRDRSGSRDRRRDRERRRSRSRDKERRRSRDRRRRSRSKEEKRRNDYSDDDDRNAVNGDYGSGRY